jgi:hypothetical protein
VLLAQLDDVWGRVQDNLAGLAADEFAWSPSEKVWHLTQKNGH